MRRWKDSWTPVITETYISSFVLYIVAVPFLWLYLVSCQWGVYMCVWQFEWMSSYPLRLVFQGIFVTSNCFFSGLKKWEVRKLTSPLTQTPHPPPFPCLFLSGILPPPPPPNLAEWLPNIYPIPPPIPRHDQPHHLRRRKCTKSKDVQRKTQADIVKKTKRGGPDWREIEKTIIMDIQYGAWSSQRGSQF